VSPRRGLKSRRQKISERISRLTGSIKPLFRILTLDEFHLAFFIGGDSMSRAQDRKNAVVDINAAAKMYKSYLD